MIKFYFSFSAGFIFFLDLCTSITSSFVSNQHFWFCFVTFICYQAWWRKLIVLNLLSNNSNLEICCSLKAKGFFFFKCLVFRLQYPIGTNQLMLITEQKKSFSYALAPFSHGKQPFFKLWKSRQGLAYVVNILSGFIRLCQWKGDPTR